MKKSKLKKWFEYKPNLAGIVTVLLHWILLVVCIKIGVIGLIVLMAIVVIDFPAFLVTVMIWLPLGYSGDDKGFFAGVILMGLILISYQWFFIGRGISEMFTAVELQIADLSIIDE